MKTLFKKFPGRCDNLYPLLLCIFCLALYTTSSAQNHPKPQFALEVNNKPYPLDGKTPIPKASRIGIKLLHDSTYLAETENPVSYRIAEIEVYAQLSLGRPTKVFDIQTDGRDATQFVLFSMGTQVRQSKPGTRVFIKLKQIYWIDENGEKKLENRFSPKEKTFSFVIR